MLKSDGRRVYFSLDLVILNGKRSLEIQDLCVPCSVLVPTDTRIAVKLNNTATHCPKRMGLPERVDMATVAMATELGHMSMQMPFFRLGL